MESVINEIEHANKLTEEHRLTRAKDLETRLQKYYDQVKAIDFENLNEKLKELEVNHLFSSALESKCTKMSNASNKSNESERKAFKHRIKDTKNRDQSKKVIQLI